MDARQYEEYVADVVRRMQFVKGARVRQRVALPGILQPGNYEIDIVIEFEIADALSFLVIVECKNWSRPVDRPVIQKLIQTRDAVRAQKAIAVSPIGFTPEAIAVAKAHGVAVWVLAEKIYVPTMGIPNKARAQFIRDLFEELSASFVRNFVVTDGSSDMLVNADDAELDVEGRYREFRRGGRYDYTVSRRQYDEDSERVKRTPMLPFVAVNLRSTEGRSPVLVDLMYEVAQVWVAQTRQHASLAGWTSEWIRSAMGRLESLKLPADRAEVATMAVATRDWPVFSENLAEVDIPPSTGRLPLADSVRQIRISSAVAASNTNTADAACPYCAAPLRSASAKQCRFCKRDWHDTLTVRTLKSIGSNESDGA